MKIELTQKEINNIVNRATNRFVKDFKANHKSADQDTLDEAMNLSFGGFLWDAIEEEIFDSRAIDDKIMEMHTMCIDNIENAILSNGYKESWKNNNLIMLTEEDVSDRFYLDDVEIVDSEKDDITVGHIVLSNTDSSYYEVTEVVIYENYTDSEIDEIMSKISWQWNLAKDCEIKFE